MQYAFVSDFFFENTLYNDVMRAQNVIMAQYVWLKIDAPYNYWHA